LSAIGIPQANLIHPKPGSVWVKINMLHPFGLSGIVYYLDEHTVVIHQLLV
jgi:hypothetical protein